MTGKQAILIINIISTQHIKNTQTTIISIRTTPLILNKTYRKTTAFKNLAIVAPHKKAGKISSMKGSSSLLRTCNKYHKKQFKLLCSLNRKPKGKSSKEIRIHKIIMVG